MPRGRVAAPVGSFGRLRHGESIGQRRDVKVPRPKNCLQSVLTCLAIFGQPSGLIGLGFEGLEGDGAEVVEGGVAALGVVVG